MSGGDDGAEAEGAALGREQGLLSRSAFAPEPSTRPPENVSEREYGPAIARQFATPCRVGEDPELREVS